MTEPFDWRDLTAYFCPKCKGLGVEIRGRHGYNCRACGGTGWRYPSEAIDKLQQHIHELEGEGEE